MSDTGDESRKAVLVIEDSLDQATLIMQFLERTGAYQVTIAQDGVRGSTLAQERAWDLIVTDLNLPGTDGVEIIRASKALHPETPILAITAYQDQSYAARAVREGADAFLPKPFDRELLLEKTESLIRVGGRGRATHGPTVLAIGAHPDDVENGCGGALLRHLDMGNRVVIMVLCDSEGDSARAPRTGEAELAARLMGARLVLANLPPDSISDHGESVEAIERVIDAFEPEIVYTHSRHDQHADRKAAFRATIMAAREAPTLYAYQSTTSTTEFSPALYVEISEYLPKKQEILSLFQTPELSRPYLRPGFIEASATYWGRFAGYGRVEPFEVVRDGLQHANRPAYSSTANVTAAM